MSTSLLTIYIHYIHTLPPYYSSPSVNLFHTIHHFHPSSSPTHNLHRTGQNPTHAFSQKHFKSGFTAKSALLFTHTLISQSRLANQILQQSTPATVDSPQGYDSQPPHKKRTHAFLPYPLPCYVTHAHSLATTHHCFLPGPHKRQLAAKRAESMR